MIELLGCSDIILLCFILAVSIDELIKRLKDRSQMKTEARRAATMPRIRKKVHDEWEQERNRQALWDYINN